MARPRGRIAEIAALHGYQRVPGRAERFVNTTTGETISRRQVENLRFQSAGYTSWSQYQRAARTQTFQRFAYYAKREHPQLTYNQIVAPESQFSQKYAQALRGGFGKRLTTKAGQAFHDFLVYLGFRQPEWEFDIGETPRATGVPLAA